MNFDHYHFHLYFQVDQIEIARTVAQNLSAQFSLRHGTVWNRPVGPHPVCTCQINVAREQFEAVVAWLMENRQGLDVFIHPEGDDDLANHRDHVMWIGRSYELKLDIFL